MTDTTAPLFRYPVPPLEVMPDDIRARVLEVHEKARFVPNVFLTPAHRPDEFRAFPIAVDRGQHRRASRHAITSANGKINAH